MFFAIAAARPAESAEKILDMSVTAVVRNNASVRITEDIKIQVDGSDIKHGIIRSIPTNYTDEAGKSRRTRFELLSALIDGARTGAAVTETFDGVEIRIGRSERTISKGIHTFTLTYDTLGWLLFHDGFDELYWNVTGTDWPYVIDHASFRLSLPGGANVLKRAVFTGRKGGRGSDFIIGEDGHIETTRTLAPGEGMTVAIGWNKGIVTKPEDEGANALWSFIFSNKITVVILLVSVIFLYYFCAWLVIGRDPTKGTVIPLYRAPRGVEPGFARYLRDARYTIDVFAADIMQLAVLGFLRFEEDDRGDLWIKPTESANDAERSKRQDDLAAASPPLHSLLTTLFSGNVARGLTLNEYNGSYFNEASENLQASYEEKRMEFYTPNTWYKRAGILLLAPFLFLLGWRLLPIAAGYIVGAIPYLNAARYLPLQRAISRLSIFLGRYAKFAAAALVVVPVLITSYRYDIVMCAGFAAALAISSFFSRILPAYTPRGTRAMAEIEGLVMYMGAAERRRLAMLYPPEETPRLFEELLPYAFALDCAETWTDSFSDILRKSSYKPDWDTTWQDSDYTWSHTGRIPDRLSSDISSSISTHKKEMIAAPGSDGGGGFTGGGFGGGGSVDGGGGGGGGEGW
ncbi:MAG: DUF2207 domain-containing protein [Synergistaceae bacterium]|jgi:uncharacterized membrane protein YgcG|nr:DUF2207 domain-containing protein [Synergistaceae bacterium]